MPFPTGLYQLLLMLRCLKLQRRNVLALVVLKLALAELKQVRRACLDRRPRANPHFGFASSSASTMCRIGLSDKRFVSCLTLQVWPTSLT